MTKTAKFTTFFAVAAFSACLMAQSGQAAPSRAATAPAEAVFGREPWPAQRALILLPLQFGPGWNLDRAKADLILPIAEQKLQQALQRTGKFSTSQVHRYNPIFLRRIQEGPLTAEEKLRSPGEEVLLTREQFNTLLANPTLEGVQRAVSSLRFEQAPLIARFAMEEVTTQLGSPSPVVMAQVTGQLFEANNPVAIKTVVVTSDPVPLYIARKVGKKTLMVRRSASDRIVTAADNSFIQIAREFVKPVDDIVLPEPVRPQFPAGAPAVGGTLVNPLPTGPIRIPPAVIEVPAGQVLGSFRVPAPTVPAPGR